MNLLEIRKKFIKDSGRYDLVHNATNYTDNGADFYINAGIRMLERLAQMEESKAKLFYPLATGAYSLTFQHNCRLISEVWINDTETRWELEKVSLNMLKTCYDKVLTDTDNGIPGYYALANLRALETTDQTSLGTFIEYNQTDDILVYDARGIIIVAPAITDYVVEINGKFKNVDLSADGDENYWTVQEADLTLRAAHYKLEAFSRGTENAKNWLSAIRDDVIELNKDIAEEESVGNTQMEG